MVYLSLKWVIHFCLLVVPQKRFVCLFEMLDMVVVEILGLHEFDGFVNGPHAALPRGENGLTELRLTLHSLELIR